MLADLWPLFGLRLGTPQLELRLPSEDELGKLADVASGGVHRQDERPFLTPWAEAPARERAVHVLQQHWARRGGWAPDAWVLELALFSDGQPVGMVALRARGFRELREVSTESWLGLAHHGFGFGTEARTALLHLAFAGLEAQSATTEVFQDNAASQGVSRKLGYRHDGISRDVRDGEILISDRMRLDRADWERMPHAPVTLTGLERCRALFGLSEASA